MIKISLLVLILQIKGHLLSQIMYTTLILFRESHGYSISKILKLEEIGVYNTLKIKVAEF